MMSRSRSRSRSAQPEGWTASRRADVVLQILRGEGSAEELSSEHGLEPGEAEGWTRRFVEAGEAALGGTDVYKRVRELERKLGEMALENDRLRKQRHR